MFDSQNSTRFARVLAAALARKDVTRTNCHTWNSSCRNLRLGNEYLGWVGRIVLQQVQRFKSAVVLATHFWRVAFAQELRPLYKRGFGIGNIYSYAWLSRLVQE